MAKSEILKQLAKGEITIDKALTRLMLLANDLDDDELSTWADNELSGYEKDAELPEYRMLHSRNLTYTGINGSYQVTNHPLPLHYLGEYAEQIKAASIREPIANIIEKAKSKSQMGLDLTSLAGTVYENTDDGYQGIQCMKITRVFDHSEFASIVQKVNQKLLKVFMKLDKEYGNLDELDINMTGITKTQIDKTAAEIKQIIYADRVTINNANLENANIINSNIQQGTAGSTQVNESTFNNIESIVAEIRKAIGTYGLDKAKQAVLLKLAEKAETADMQKKLCKVKKALLAIGGILKDFAVGVAASVIANKIV